MKNKKSVAVVAALGCLALAFAGGIAWQTSSCKHALRNAAYYETNYLSMVGASSTLPNGGSYNLRSLDGGKNWIAVEVKNSKVITLPDGNLSTDQEVIVLGKAEDVYPGLVAHLQGVDRLVDYATKNGPLTLSGENAQAEEALLAGAGFQVKSK